MRTLNNGGDCLQDLDNRYGSEWKWLRITRELESPPSPPYYEDYFLLRVEKRSLFLICGQAFSLEKNQGNALQG